jgi:hypothetical protein
LETTWRVRVAQFFFGGLAGAAAKLVAMWAGRLPALELLGSTSLAFVVAATLFGWPGLAGVTVLHVVWATVRGSSADYVSLTALVYALAGAMMLATFRLVPGLGRGMPNLKSFVAYGLAAAGGALLTGSVISLGFDGSWEVAAVWIRSTIVTVLVFGAPLLILGERLPKAWLAPIRGEIPSRRRPAFALAEGRAWGDLPVIEQRPEPDPWRAALAGSGMILAVSATTLVAGRTLTASTFWVGLLYLVPIHWACRRHGLRGGLLAAGGACLAFLVTDAAAFDGFGPETQRIHELASYAYVLVFAAVGSLVGAAWERERDLLEQLFQTNRRLRTDLQRVARALSSAVEAKDLYTEGHLQRVSNFAVEVGRRLGLTERDLELLQIASALHDVGKIGIPEHILNKPGPLDPAERDVVQRHPEIGARILENVEGLEYAAPLVRHHQERWDGRCDGEFPGYPHGLAGDEIPLGARIIAVVDAFDAMTTDRSYRPGASVERATQVLRDEADRQFDPSVVRAFLEVLERRPWHEGRPGRADG